MHRVIKHLHWAKPCVVPQFARNARTRGVKHQGVKYERRLAKELGACWFHGQWFEYLDTTGHGYCQVDFLRETADAVVVLEAKLRWVAEGHSQLEQLYRPVIEKVYGKPMVGIVVCKLLVPGIQAAVAQTLASAIAAATTGRPVALHWSEKAPINPSPRYSRPATLPLSSGASSR